MFQTPQDRDDMRARDWADDAAQRRVEVQIRRAQRRRVTLIVASASVVLIAVATLLLALAVRPGEKRVAASESAPASPAKAAVPATQVASVEKAPAGSTAALAEIRKPAPEKRVVPVKKAAVAKKAAPKAAAKASSKSAPTLPEQMKYLRPGSTQIIITTGARLGSNRGTVYVFNKEGGRWVQKLKTPTRMGTNGLINGETRRSGNSETPTGIWKIGSFLFGKAKRPPAGTRMPYRQIKSTSYWSAEHDSTYNTWVNSSRPISGERLINPASLQYEFVLDSAYNEPPNKRVIGRGTAIFLHVMDPPNVNNGFTHGCVGISRSAMIKVFKLIDPKRNPSMAIGTLKKGSATSIWAY